MKDKPFDAQLDHYFTDLGLRYAKGDYQALLVALKFCAMRQVSMPDWLALVVAQGIMEWQTGNVKTLDEAWRVERKGQLVARVREDMLKFAVFDEVMRLHYEEGKPIVATTFEEVSELLESRIVMEDGVPLKLGKTTVEKYYYAAKKRFQSIPGSPLQYSIETQSKKKKVKSRKK